jgi:hypothetical protein
MSPDVAKFTLENLPEGVQELTLPGVYGYEQDSIGADATSKWQCQDPGIFTLLPTCFHWKVRRIREPHLYAILDNLQHESDNDSSVWDPHCVCAEQPAVFSYWTCLYSTGEASPSHQRTNGPGDCKHFALNWLLDEPPHWRLLLRKTAHNNHHHGDLQ